MKAVLTLTAIFTSSLIYALSATESRPVAEHMLEVNAQWQHHRAPLGLLTFENDIARIQHHLFLVHQELSSISVHHLTIQQRLKREALLDTLLTYAKTAKFPRNTGHAERTPYFIDQYGTACAVGYLILASGNKATADFLSQNFNYNFLVDMPKEPIVQWANQHGFEFSELQWIQPAYEYYPTLRFLPVDEGIDGVVYKTVYISEEQMTCIGGDFTNNGYSNFRCYDGNDVKYETLLDGVQGVVHDFEPLQEGEFAVAGSFELGDDSKRGVAKVSAGSRTYIDINGLDYSSHAVVSDGSEALFDAEFGSMSGLFQSAFSVGTAQEILQVNGTILTVVKHDGYVIIGGEFTEVTTAQGTQSFYNFVAWKDSSLYSLDCPFDQKVRAIRSINGTLYVAGDCEPTEPNTSCVLSWDGTSWSSIFDSLSIEELALSNQGVAWFNDVVWFENALILGGNIEYESAGSFAYSLAKHLIKVSEEGQISPYGYLNGQVHSAAPTSSGDLMIGGMFTSHTYGAEGGGWMQYAHFAVPYLAVSADDLTAANEIDPSNGTVSIYPVPASENISVDIGQKVMDWVIRDITGKQVWVESQSVEEGVDMKVSSLSPGSYFIHLTDVHGTAHRGQFVVGPY